MERNSVNWLMSNPSKWSTSLSIVDIPLIFRRGSKGRINNLIIPGDLICDLLKYSFPDWLTWRCSIEIWNYAGRIFRENGKTHDKINGAENVSNKEWPVSKCWPGSNGCKTRHHGSINTTLFFRLFYLSRLWVSGSWTYRVLKFNPCWRSTWFLIFRFFVSIPRDLRPLWTSPNIF